MSEGCLPRGRLSGGTTRGRGFVRGGHLSGELYPTFLILNPTPDPDLNPCISFTGVNPSGTRYPQNFGWRGRHLLQEFKSSPMPSSR